MNKILINVDSRQRNTSSYPNSNFFKIGNESESDLNFYNYLNFRNIDYISLSSIEIPNSFYIFTPLRFNNFFYVTSIIKKFDNYVEYNIPDYYLVPTYQSQILYGSGYVYISTGNYSADILANEINIKLNQLQFNIGYFEEGSPIIFIVDGLYCKYNPTILKLNFFNKSNTFAFNINFNNNNNQYTSLGYMLGYRYKHYKLEVLSDITNDYYAIIPQDTITLPKTIPEAMVDIDGERYFFIRINDYGNLYLNHKTPKKVLGKILLNSSKENFIFVNTNDYLYKSHKFVTPININTLEIELLDYNGNRLDNSNCDYSFTLELGQIYDKHIYNNIYKKHELTFKNEEVETELKNYNNLLVNNKNIMPANKLTDVVETPNNVLNIINTEPQKFCNINGVECYENYDENVPFFIDKLKNVETPETIGVEKINISSCKSENCDNINDLFMDNTKINLVSNDDITKLETKKIKKTKNKKKNKFGFEY